LPHKTENKEIMAKKNQLTTSDHLAYPEYERLLECLHNDQEYMWEMYARMSFCTACRASDILQFRWKDILGVSSLTITEQKTGKTRRVPLNTSVQKRFNELYELLGRPDKKDFVMRGKFEDKPMTIQCVNQKLKDFKYKYRLKITNFSTHTFRKTFGRYVYDYNNHSAESLLLLNKILNHSSIQVTKTYIGITQEEIDGVFSSIKF